MKFVRGETTYVPPGIERERHDFNAARRQLEAAIAQRDAVIARLNATLGELAPDKLNELSKDGGGVFGKWLDTLDYETAERLSVLCAERASAAKKGAA